MAIDLRTNKLNPYTEFVIDERERFGLCKRLIEERGVRYANCDLSSFDIEGDKERADVVSRVAEFIDDMPARLRSGNGGLILLGPPGTGKDHLLMATMKAATLQHGFRVRWVDGLQLFSDVKAAIANNETKTLINELCKAQILAISDPVPPRDELSAFELQVIRNLIERRYSAMRATWITTNVQTAADAKRLFSDAVLTRLLDGALELFCGWESYRRPYAA